MILTPPIPSVDEQLRSLAGRPVVLRIPVANAPRYVRGILTCDEPDLPGLEGLPFHVCSSYSGTTVSFRAENVAHIERHPGSLPVIHQLPRA